jgi:hypothetical protein
VCCLNLAGPTTTAQTRFQKCDCSLSALLVSSPPTCLAHNQIDDAYPLMLLLIHNCLNPSVESSSTRDCKCPPIPRPRCSVFSVTKGLHCIVEVYELLVFEYTVRAMGVQQIQPTPPRHYVRKLHSQQRHRTVHSLVPSSDSIRHCCQRSESSCHNAVRCEQPASCNTADQCISRAGTQNVHQLP